MSKPGKPPSAGRVSDENPSRSAHGHDACIGQEPARAGTNAEDPHVAWLKEWRYLRAQMAGEKINPSSTASPNERLRWLRDQIAHTPAKTTAGLLAQAELICDLAWNEVVASTARHLAAGLRRKL